MSPPIIHVILPLMHMQKKRDGTFKRFDKYATCVSGRMHYTCARKTDAKALSKCDPPFCYQSGLCEFSEICAKCAWKYTKLNK